MDSLTFSIRDFIQKGTLVSIAATNTFGCSLGISAVVSTTANSKQVKFNYTSTATKKLTQLLHIKYPIIQAPTTGVINSSFTSAFDIVIENGVSIIQPP